MDINKNHSSIRGKSKIKKNPRRSLRSIAFISAELDWRHNVHESSHARVIEHQSRTRRPVPIKRHLYGGFHTVEEPARAGCEAAAGNGKAEARRGDICGTEGAIDEVELDVVCVGDGVVALWAAQREVGVAQHGCPR